MRRVFQVGSILFMLLTAGANTRLTAQTSTAASGDSEEGFVALFNGKDLTGWEGDTNLWKVRDGLLVGQSPGMKYNDFLQGFYPPLIFSPGKRSGE